MRWFVAGLVVFVLGEMVDLAETLYGTTHGYAEGNPLLHALTALPLAIALVKLVATALFIVGFVWLYRAGRTWRFAYAEAWLLLMFGIGVNLGAIGHNVMIFAR